MDALSIAVVWVLQLGLLALPALGQQACSASSQRAALQSIYIASGGPEWLRQDSWNTSLPCYRPLTSRLAKLASQSVELPSHCCWEGVFCCLSELDNDTWLQCTHQQCACGVGNVTALTLGRNHLTGELGDILSPGVLEPLSCNLREVFMGGNGLLGTLPDYLSDLPDLRVLSLGSNALRGSLPDSLSRLSLLEELDLSSNALTGSVPAALCGGATRFSPLRDLALSNNKLTGELVVTDCDSLINLDLQNNDLYGPLPDLASYRQLHILRLGNNSFSGPIPQPPFNLRLLVMLDLSNNYLTGTIPNFVGNGSQLTLVRLYGNYLAGSIPSDIFTLGTLGTLLAYDNNLTGTLPENIGDARGLTGLQLQQNSLHGTIPASLRRLAYSRATVDLSLTNMSCCGYDFVEGLGYRYFNTSLPRLPPFLTLATDAAKPVWDNTDQVFTNMRCPSLSIANATAEIPVYETAEYFASHKIRVLGNSSFTPPPLEPLLTTLDKWSLDPEYYLYQGCFCVVGFREVWVQPTPGVPSMGPRLTCVPITTPWFRAYPWAVVLIVLGGLLGAAWLTYLSCYRRGKRAAILQNYYNLRKRVKGEPLGGQVSIVVTDIEGYSDLMKQSPELMTRALNLHNALIRKARWANFGYTVEQEGDSYVLVFYEALDAVIFCLQTQLALNRQTWPEGLFVVEQRDAPSRRRTPGPGLLNALSLMTNNLTHSLFGGRISAQSLPAHQTSEDRSLSIAAMPSSLRAAGMSTDGMRTEGMRVDSRQSSAVAGREYSAMGTPGAGPGPGQVSTGFFKGHHLLFNGMRVRMGIATGLLPPGHMSKGSAVMDLAKMVSDAASGGQILMDECTFADIKERLEELGAVDHNGMNFKKLNAIQPPWYSCLRRKSVRNPDEALLLDMGEYTYCPGTKRLPLFQLDASTQPATPAGAPPTMPSTPKAGQRSRGPDRIRLFQVAPPALVGRAKVFGNKLSLKDDWVCSDLPYFSAPGTLDAPLGSVDGPVFLPPITMVFAIVENGKGFAAKFRRDARRVHDVIAACIRACLRCCASGAGAGGAAVAPALAAAASAAAAGAAPGVPGGAVEPALGGGGGYGGGYLCRMQDGDLKYMVAFASPQAAVEWALLLQDVLMYAEWPDAALKFWREECDEQGRMVFRGPRMKIGVCEGSPRSIIPDHIGRADYHGASINQAARYMDAAAHGGMIALEAALALKVMAAWQEAEVITIAGHGEVGLAVVAETSPTGDKAAARTAVSASAAAADAGQPYIMLGSRRMSSVLEAEAGEELHMHPTASAHSSTAPAAPRRNGVGGGRAPHRAPAPWDDDAPSSAASATAVGAVEMSSVAGPVARSSAGSASGSVSRGGRSDPLPRLVLGHHGSHSHKVAPAPVPASLRRDAGGASTSGGAGGTQRSGDADAAHALQSAGPSGGALELWPQARRIPAQDDAPTPHTNVTRPPWGEYPGMAFAGAAVEAAAAVAAEAAAAAGAAAAEEDGADSGTGYARARSLRTTATVSLRDTHALESVAAAAHDAAAAAGPSAVAEGVEGGGGDAAALCSPAEVRLALDTCGDDDGPGRGPASGASPGRTGLVATLDTGACAAGCKSPPSHAASEPSMTSLHNVNMLPSLQPHSWAADAEELLPPPPQHLVCAEAVDVGPYGCCTSGGGGATRPQRSNGPSRPPPLEPVSSPVASEDAFASFDGQLPLPGGEITVSGGLAGGSSSAPNLSCLDGAEEGAEGLGLRTGQQLQVPALSPMQPRPKSPLRHTSPNSMWSNGPLGPTTSARSPSSLCGSNSPLLLSSAHRAFSAGATNASVAAAAAAFAIGRQRPATTSGSGGGTASAGTTPVNRALSAAAAAATPAGSGASVSSVARSPRPPALTPLALPSDKERDAALAADRAAAEEGHKIQVDGPADARYRVRVAAYRIGVFRFKGSPEDISMAHIVLEHLASRRFPADAPKGKGGKVADASGLLQQCETSLPDLASLLKERFLLSRPSRNLPPPAPEVAVSSPSSRRLRALLGAHSFAGPASNGGGSGPGTSPTGVAARVFSKTRSLAVRMTGDGYGGGIGGGLPNCSSMPSSGAQQRRASGGFIGQLAQLASASMRWASGGGRDGRDGDAGYGHVNPERGRTTSGPGVSFARNSAVSTAASEGSAGGAPSPTSPEAASRLGPGWAPLAVPSASVAAGGDAPGLEAGAAGQQPGTPGTSSRAGSSGGASGGGEAAVAFSRRPAGAALVLGDGRCSPASRPSPLGTSPLRHRTAAGDPLPERASPSPAGAASSAFAEAGAAAGGWQGEGAVATGGAARGEERV